MTDFPISDEAVEAVAKAIEAACDSPYEWDQLPPAVRGVFYYQADVAIAAFVEAEGLRVESHRNRPIGDPRQMEPTESRLVTDWRKRD